MWRRRDTWRDLHTARRRQNATFGAEEKPEPKPQPAVDVEEPPKDGGWPERDTLFFDDVDD